MIYPFFFPERMKIEKGEKLVANLHDKEEYVIHIRNLKQAFNHGLKLKKVHCVIKFNKRAQKKSKKLFLKRFSQVGE